ncbi:MAG: hypothetical protein JWM19_7609, partial [Actinomycetia bacterium]|nr:hypothetical protein [Actinomycetes bacterium]
MDARRLGMGVALPRAFLEAAASGYLDDPDWDALPEDWLEQALADTAAPAKGARGPLAPIRPRAVTGPGTGVAYRLADYLDQHGRAVRAGQIPPPGFWAALARHACPGDLLALGDSARALGLYRDAAQLWKKATAHGDPYAPYRLIEYRHLDGRQAAAWAVERVSLDDAGRVAGLLQALQEDGADEEARALLHRRPSLTVALTDSPDVVRLLKTLRQLGGDEADKEVRTVLGLCPAAHVDPGHLGGLRDLLGWLQAEGQTYQAAVLAGRAAREVQTDNPQILARLLEILRDAGAAEQVKMLLALDPAANVAVTNISGVQELFFTLRDVDRVLGRTPRRGTGGFPAGISARPEVLKPAPSASVNPQPVSRA